MDIERQKGLVNHQMKLADGTRKSLRDAKTELTSLRDKMHLQGSSILSSISSPVKLTTSGSEASTQARLT